MGSRRPRTAGSSPRTSPITTTRRGPASTPTSPSTTVSSTPTTPLRIGITRQSRELGEEDENVQDGREDAERADCVRARGDGPERAENAVQEPAEEAREVVSAEQASAVEVREDHGLGLAGERGEGGRGGLDERRDRRDLGLERGELGARG